MDFLYKNRRIIVVVLAGLMIGLGVFQMLTGIEVNQNISRAVEYIVLFGALYLLLILPKTYELKMQNSEPEVSEDDFFNEADDAQINETSREE